MNVKWLVENFEQDNKIWKLIAELKRRNQPLEFVDYFNYSIRNSVLDAEGNPTQTKFTDDDCVIFQGSIQMALWLKRHKPWVPCVWLDPDKFKCTTFYSYLGEHLFNDNYEFTTVGEFKRKYESYYSRSGIDNCLFIRPDSGLKSFTGQVFYKENHVTDWKFFDQSTKPEDIIVVASPKVIKAEYRLVIAEGEVIASSQYQREGKREQLPGCPPAVATLGHEIANVIDRDMKIGPMYVVDIATTHSGVPRLMEINCFNCAGLYECDKSNIVEAANMIAWKEYQAYKADEVQPQ